MLFAMLQGVQRALLPAASAATSGHVTLLKQKALTAILRRLDALLFGKLLGGGLTPTAALTWHTLLGQMGQRDV